MKKFGFILVPVLFLGFGILVVPKLLSSGANPMTLIFLSMGMLAVLLLFRPKAVAPKSMTEITDAIADDFCKGAFADKPELNKKFVSALTDISKNMPKAAVQKLQKLAAECTTDAEKYAVALATALAYRQFKDFRGMIREYNKAVVLNPKADIAYQIGDCHQHLGNLDKARDSYEFAMELDAANPQYPSSLGTVYVGEGDYDTAMDYARDALELDAAFPQALATMAICYGMQDDALMHNHYLELAMNNGYSREKIESTIATLKKREKR